MASLIGVGVYNAYLKRVSLQKIFFWSTILGTILGLTQVSSALFCELLSQTKCNVVEVVPCFRHAYLLVGNCLPVAPCDRAKSAVGH